MSAGKSIKSGKDIVNIIGINTVSGVAVSKIDNTSQKSNSNEDKAGTDCHYKECVVNLIIQHLEEFSLPIARIGALIPAYLVIFLFYLN